MAAIIAFQSHRTAHSTFLIQHIELEQRPDFRSDCNTSKANPIKVIGSLIGDILTLFQVSFGDSKKPVCFAFKWKCTNMAANSNHLLSVIVIKIETCSTGRTRALPFIRPKEPKG